MLFSKVLLSKVLATHQKRVSRAINFDGLEILLQEKHQLINNTNSRYLLNPLSLQLNKMFAEVVDRFVFINIPYSGSEPFIYPGDPKLVEYYHEDTGRILPNNLEEGCTDELIILKIDTTGLSRDALKTLIDSHIAVLQQIVDSINDEIDSFNTSLLDSIDSLIDTKINKSTATETLFKKAKPNIPIKRGKGKPTL